jgi:hypothetical protein
MITAAVNPSKQGQRAIEEPAPPSNFKSNDTVHANSQVLYNVSQAADQDKQTSV